MENKETGYFRVSEMPAPEEMECISEAMENHKRTQTMGEYDLPGVEYQAAVKRSGRGGARRGARHLTSLNFKAPSNRQEEKKYFIMQL